MADTPQPAKKTQAGKAQLPTHKDDLVAEAIRRGIPSYEAWALTVPELTARLEA